MKSKFVIVNLKRRPDRKENIQKMLEKNQITNYEFFEAVDGKTLKGDSYIYNLFLGNDFNWRRGVIGCALSHYNIWKKLVSSDSDYFCILEDDISLSQDFNNLYGQCDKFVSEADVDILFLGYSMFNENRKKYANIYNSHQSHLDFLPYNSNLYIGGFFGYIITKSGANKMLKYIDENGIRHGIDYLIKLASPTKLQSLVTNKYIMNVYECQPQIIFTDWVDSLESKVDSDIQKDFDCITFNPAELYTLRTINGKKYKYYQGLDSSDNDIKYVGYQPLETLANMAELEPSCIAFNTLGFLKSTVGRITTSPYIHPTRDGLYVLEEKSLANKNKIRVKMICNWCSSSDLCLEWNHMSQGNFTWNNIEITSSDDNIDYYVIINRPSGNEFYVPEKTIIFHMEPWCYSPKQNWGVKTWGEWAKPDPGKFLQVRSHDKYVNNGMWQLKMSYTQFKTEPIIKNQNYGNTISTICSSKYFDPGHIKRIDFLKFLESKNDPLVTVHIYNHDNIHKFKNYQGPHPPGNKDVGITPYKYYFMGENNEEYNFITEKIWEPLLTESLCFYWGCPNISDYINPLAYVLLDLSDFEKSFQIIKEAISNNLWEKRLDIIREEKKKVLEYYNFFPTLERIIQTDIYPKDIKTICFLHSCTLNTSISKVNTSVLDELYSEIVSSGLLDKLDYLVINNIGNPIDHIVNKKVKIINWSENPNLFEIPTIKMVSSFCKAFPNVKVLYLHTKGITHNSGNITDWRRYLSYFMVTKFKECMDELNYLRLSVSKANLNNHDVVGCNYLSKPFPHFSGNFWWANSNYIATLETNLKVRHDAEWWILSGKNPKFYSIHDSNINHYESNYPKSMYVSKTSLLSFNNFKEIHIYNNSICTSELSQCFYNYLNTHTDKIVKIVNKIELNNPNLIYIIICPAGGVYKTHKPLYYICYQLESIYNNTNMTNTEYINYLREGIEIWDYNESNVEYLKSLGIKNVKYLPIGYDSSLTYSSSYDNRDIDVLFLGFNLPRRSEIQRQLTDRCYNVLFVNDKTPDEMKRLISRSKICLNIHAYKSETVLETPRLSLYLSNFSCIISEKSIDKNEKMYEDGGIIFCSYSEIVDNVDILMNDFEKRKQLAEKSYFWYMSERTLEKIWN